jgi:hypothetical protein
VLPVEDVDCEGKLDVDTELLDDGDALFDIELVIDCVEIIVREVVCEINEVSVTSVVKDGDDDGDRSDVEEMLSCKEGDGKED